MMLEALSMFFCILGGALTTTGILHTVMNLNDKWLLKQMLPSYCFVTGAGILSIVIGFLLP